MFFITFVHLASPILIVILAVNHTLLNRRIVVELCTFIIVSSFVPCTFCPCNVASHPSLPALVATVEGSDEFGDKEHPFSIRAACPQRRRDISVQGRCPYSLAALCGDGTQCSETCTLSWFVWYLTTFSRCVLCEWYPAPAAN